MHNAVRDAWQDPIKYSEPISPKQAAKDKRHGVPEPPEQPPRRRVDHFVMNLPATAIEFLDAFRGSLKEIRDSDPATFEEVYGDRMPAIHCHAFSSEGDPELDRPSLIQVRVLVLSHPTRADNCRFAFSGQNIT